MVYLHSNDSGQLNLKVSEAGNGWGTIEGDRNEKADHVFKEFINKLNSNPVYLGGKALPWIVKRNPPGNSQHFGASLPMRKNPRKYETDVLGTPFGMNRVHVVDTSIFSTVVGTPTTYPAMANAARIAHQSIEKMRKI